MNALWKEGRTPEASQQCDALGSVLLENPTGSLSCILLPAAMEILWMVCEQRTQSINFAFKSFRYQSEVCVEKQL